MAFSFTVRRWLWVLTLSCGSLLATLELPGADLGAEVIVIFNSRMPESKQVAEYYAQRRQVPADQVFGLDLPVTESMSRAEFLDQLHRPLLKKLEEAQLVTVGAQKAAPSRWTAARFRYAALCYGVPTKIAHDPTLVEPSAETLRPELRRDEASVDSQLTCLPVDEKEFKWIGPWVNPFYGATNASQLHPTNGILLVTRLDGPSADIARGLVDKALEAETNGLWGRAYFDSGYGKNNTNYLLGDVWIRGSAEFCRRLGFEMELDNNPDTFPGGMPMSQVAFYAGWYADHANGPFSWRGVEFMPGAFAYHLHSFSAATLRSTNQHWVGPLLARGATATMGSVNEPYLGGTPDLAMFFMRFVFMRFSFGEAAWASQNAMSWQNLAVGDPLYCPFRLRPDQRIEELERRQSKLAEWYHLLNANMNLVRSGDLESAIESLERVPLTRKSAVLKEKLADLFWANRKLTYALDAYESALKLDPTPMQKLRLMLRSAERLVVYGSHAQACELYQRLLKEYPDYPDLLSVYVKLLPLAKKLNNKEEIERCEREIKRLAPPPSAKP